MAKGVYKKLEILRERQRQRQRDRERDIQLTCRKVQFLTRLQALLKINYPSMTTFTL